MALMLSLVLATVGIPGVDLPPDRVVREVNGDLMIIRVRLAPAIDGEEGVAVEQRLRVQDDGSLAFLYDVQSEATRQYYDALCAARGMVPVYDVSVLRGHAADVSWACRRHVLQWKWMSDARQGGVRGGIDPCVDAGCFDAVCTS